VEGELLVSMFNARSYRVVAVHKHIKNVRLEFNVALEEHNSIGMLGNLIEEDLKSFTNDGDSLWVIESVTFTHIYNSGE
jgi:hypothetical protein